MNPKEKDVQWPVTNADKLLIVELGRLLNKVVYDFAKEKAKDGKYFHMKLLQGSFQYVQAILNSKQNLVAEDILIVNDAVLRNNLNDLIEEPFQQTPEPTLEALRQETLKKIEEEQKQLAEIDEIMKKMNPEANGDVEIDAPKVEGGIASPYPGPNGDGGDDSDSSNEGSSPVPANR